MARDLALTLAGGGNRALVQIGLLRRWWPLLEPRIAAISTVSAGSSMAVSLLTGRERETTAYWLGRRAGVTRNVHWRRLLAWERPTPHTPIYRDTVRFALRDGGFERLRALPFPVFVLTALPPRGLPVSVAAVVGMFAYSLERQMWYGQLHPTSARRLGFRPAVALRSRLRHKEGASTGSHGGVRHKSLLSEHYGVINRLRITRKFWPHHLPGVWLSLALVVLDRLVHGELERAALVLRLMFAPAKWRRDRGR